MAHTVELELRIHWETDDAYLVSTDGVKSNAKWIPKSLLIEVDEGEKAMALITMPYYLAVDKELV